MSQTKYPATKPHLEWLFIAYFRDGSVIQQTQDDKPKEQPEGSAFTDVLARARATDLVAFELRHEDGVKVATVDLQTGNFVVGGIPFCAHNQHFDPDARDLVFDEAGEPVLDEDGQQLTKRRYNLELIFFREVKHDQQMLATVQDDMSIKEEPIGEPNHYVNRYFIGWQTEVQGKMKQVTIAVG